MKVILEDSVAPTFAQNVPFNFGDTCHTTGQKVFAAGLGQLGSIVLGVHAGIGDKHGAAQVPAAQIGADFLDSADIGRITSYNVCYTKLLREVIMKIMIFMK